MVNAELFPLETARIFLRPLKMEDAETLVEICNDPVTHQFTISIPYPYTLKDAHFFLEKVAKVEDKNNFASILGIFEKQSGKLAGVIGLHPKHEKSSAEIGFQLGKEFRGKGYIHEAIEAMTRYGFKHLGLEKISAVVFEGNLPSKRAIERAGFVQEGFMKSHVRKGDKRVDAFLYGLLK